MSKQAAKKKFPSNYFDSENTIKIGDIPSGTLTNTAEVLLANIGLAWEDKAPDMNEDIYNVHDVRDWLNRDEENRRNIPADTIQEIEELCIAMDTRDINYIRIINL